MIAALLFARVAHFTGTRYYSGSRATTLAFARSQHALHAAIKSLQYSSLWLRFARHHWIAQASFLHIFCSMGASSACFLPEPVYTKAPVCRDMSYLDSVFDSVFASFKAFAGSFFTWSTIFWRVSGFFRASSLAFLTTFNAWPFANPFRVSICVRCGGCAAEGAVGSVVAIGRTATCGEWLQREVTARGRRIWCRSVHSAAVRGSATMPSFQAFWAF